MLATLKRGTRLNPELDDGPADPKMLYVVPSGGLTGAYVPSGRQMDGEEDRRPRVRPIQCR
jgi:hypothetical protein